MIAGMGPTFFNEYEIYGDRHFLRAAAPVEPAEYRPGPQLDLPTLGGALLTDPAWADLDAFALSTLAPFRSLVVRVGPTESRPPSIYREVYAGRYYELWQQPAHGDHARHRARGARRHGHPPVLRQRLATRGPRIPLRDRPGRRAKLPAGPQPRRHRRRRPRPAARLRATEPDRGARDRHAVVERMDPRSAERDADADRRRRERDRAHRDPARRQRLPAVARRKLRARLHREHRRATDRRGRRRARPGRRLRTGRLAADARPGTHAITITYPNASLAPGSADSEEYTSLSAIALSPPSSQMTLAAVKPAAARSLCGRSLDWIEVVAPV